MKTITDKFYDKKAEGTIETRTVPDSNVDLEARIILLEFDVQELKLKLKEKT